MLKVGDEESLKGARQMLTFSDEYVQGGLESLICTGTLCFVKKYFWHVCFPEEEEKIGFSYNSLRATCTALKSDKVT